MVDLSWSDIDPLMIALNDPLQRVRVAALRALVRLPLSPEAREKISFLFKEFFSQVPIGEKYEDQTIHGIPVSEIIKNATYIQLPNVLSYLYNLLKSDHDDIRRETAYSLAKIHDPMALSVLLSELDCPDIKRNENAAELLSLIHLPENKTDDLKKEVKQAYRKQKNPDIRFWLAIVLAQYGEINEIRQILTQLLSKTINLHYGYPDYQPPGKISPFIFRNSENDVKYLFEELQKRGPFPEKIQKLLSQISQDGWDIARDIATNLLYINFHAKITSDPKLLAEWKSADISLIVPLDKLYNEPVDKQKETELINKSNGYAKELLALYDNDQNKFLDQIDLYSHRGYLDYVEPPLSSSLISKIIRAEIQKTASLTSPVNPPLFDTAVQLASDFKIPFIPDVLTLFENYFLIYKSEAKKSDQIAWLISRGDIHLILSVILPHLKDENEQDRICAAQIIEDIMWFSDQPFAPTHGKEFIQYVSQPPSPTEKLRQIIPYASRSVSVPQAILMESASLPSSPKPKRVVNTIFTSRKSPDISIGQHTALKSDNDYYFCLNIGLPFTGSIPLTKGTIDEIDKTLEMLPKNAELAVRLFGYKNGIEIIRNCHEGLLIVNTNGEVSVKESPIRNPDLQPKSKLLGEWLYFPVRTPKKTGTYQLRCNIYFGQILLRSYLIHAEISDNPICGDAYHGDLDYTLTQTFDFSRINQLEPHLMSIQLNSNDDGTRSFFLRASNNGNIITEKLDIDPIGLDKCITYIRAGLRKAAWGSADEWNNEGYRYSDRSINSDNLNRLAQDLFRMAQGGFTLYSRLQGSENQLDKFKPIIAESGYIQIAMKNKPTYYVPISAIYDYPLRVGDQKNYKLCPEFIEAYYKNTPLNTLDCFHGNCPSVKNDTNNLTVCPGGFWGFRHFLGMPISVQDNDATRSLPIDDGLEISVAVCTAMNSCSSHVNALKGTSSKFVVRKWDDIDNYDELFSNLHIPPHIVYFYCHGGTARLPDGAGEPYLIIGSKNSYDEIHESNFRLNKIKWDSLKPLIFLNGCHTASITPISALNLIDPLMNTYHCAGVIGTEITIFEEMASAFAAECFKQFLNGESIGVAVRNARLKLLSEGDPLGLSYIPFVWAPLKIEKIKTIIS